MKTWVRIDVWFAGEACLLVWDYVTEKVYIDSNREGPNIEYDKILIEGVQWNYYY